MTEAPYDLLARLLHRIAPEVDLDTVDRAEPLQDAADLDSMNFLCLIAALRAETGIDVPERDYPSVATVDGFVAYVDAAAAGKPTITAATDADRPVSLCDDRRIVIRPVSHADAADLMALYDTLDDDHRYPPFSGTSQPPLACFEEMATVGQRGGARVVAVRTGPPPVEDRIIGEAGYTLLPNGDGELGIVVARRWRGWLGPYLLDALVEIAAAAGVPNLEADVLTVNRPMLAVLRARGSVVMDHHDRGVVRLLIATSGRPPELAGAARSAAGARGGPWWSLARRS